MKTWEIMQQSNKSFKRKSDTRNNKRRNIELGKWAQTFEHE